MGLLSNTELLIRTNPKEIHSVLIYPIEAERTYITTSTLPDGQQRKRRQPYRKEKRINNTLVVFRVVPPMNFASQFKYLTRKIIK